jgi:hypothetical protein
MRRPSGISGAGVLACVALVGAGCSAAPSPNAGVVFAGAADGRALDALLAVPPQASADEAAVIDAPINATILAANPPQRFSWHAPSSEAPVVAPAPGADPGSMSGAGFYLLFSTDQVPELLRVFTSEASYTPDEAAWETISSAEMWVTFRVINASFVDDALAPGGGPFVGTPIAFCPEH